jgi:GxxExxY protein
VRRKDRGAELELLKLQDEPGLRADKKADADCTDFADERGKNTLLYGDTTRVILGAFYSVHLELGFGFLEAVYANALTVLLEHAGLRVDRQVPFEIEFHGRSVGYYRADLVVEARIVVEIKAGRTIIPQHSAQLLNYLKASRLQVGLLLNFGEKAEFKRVVCTRNLPR